MSPRADPRFLPARSTRNVPPKIQGNVQPDWPDEDSDEDPEYLPSGTETSDTDEEGDLDDSSCPDSSSACESSDDDISAAPQL